MSGDSIVVVVRNSVHFSTTFVSESVVTLCFLAYFCSIIKT